MYVDQVDAAGTITPFAYNQSNEGHGLYPMIAASNGHVLWTAFTTDDTFQPNDVFMVATTGGTATSGTPSEVVAFGECPNLCSAP